MPALWRLHKRRLSLHANSMESSSSRRYVSLDVSFCTPSSVRSYELIPNPAYTRTPLVNVFSNSSQSDTDEGGNTFLHQAARAADLKKMKKLLPLASRSSLLIANAAGFMPLHYIAKHRGKAWSRILEIVLKKGGFTDSANLDGDTPLHIAARALNIHGVNSLVMHGSGTGKFRKYYRKNRAGETPLDVAVAATNDPAMSEAILSLVRGTKFLNKLFKAVWIKYSSSAASDQSWAGEVECPQLCLLWLLSLQRDSPCFSRGHLITFWRLRREDKLNTFKKWMNGRGWLQFMLLWLVPREDFDVGHIYAGGMTVLHIALFEELEDIAKLLFKRHDLLEVDLEDEKGHTPVQHAVEKGFREIEIILMRRPEVKESVERLYRDRQVYVDAAHAILVGSALIASITFTGWLQPPLGYGNGQENGSFYVAMQGHPAISSFWSFNSLSFLLAMAAVIAGARAVLPRPDLYIGTAVRKLKAHLSMAACLLLMSAICVIGAFASAGFAVLPPSLKWQRGMILTVGLGGSVNLLAMVLFLKALLHLRPGHAKRIKEMAVRRAQQRMRACSLNVPSVS